MHQLDIDGATQGITSVWADIVQSNGSNNSITDCEYGLALWVGNYTFNGFEITASPEAEVGAASLFSDKVVLNDIDIIGDFKTALSIHSNSTDSDVTVSNINAVGATKGIRIHAGDNVTNGNGVTFSSAGTLTFKADNIVINSENACIDAKNAELGEGSYIDNFEFSSSGNPDQIALLSLVENLRLGGTESKISGNGSVGVNCDLSENIIIENIDFSGCDADVGIHVNSGDAISIRDNILTSASAQTGIECDMVTQLFICGNEIANCDEGTIIENGTAPPPSTDPSAPPPTPLTRYLLNDHYDTGTDGLSIRRSAIGEQPHAGNTWDSSNGWITPDDEIVRNSQFPVVSSAWWPTATNVNPTSVWFRVDPLGSTVSGDCSDIDVYNFIGDGDPDCPSGIRGHCLPDPWYPECEDILIILENILGGTLPQSMSPSQKYNAQLLLAEQLQVQEIPLFDEHIADCLNQIEELIPQFLGEGQQAVVRQSNLMIQLVDTVHRQSPSTRQALNGLDNQVNGLYTAISALDPEDADDQMELLSLAQALSSIRAQQADIKSIYREETLLKAEALYYQTLGAEIDGTIEGYHDKALEISAYLLSKSVEELPQNYISDLYVMANLCPVDYGYPVYYARTILYAHSGIVASSYNDDAFCTEALNLREKTKQTSQVKLHPNPTKDELQLRLDTTIETPITIAITNPQGNQVLTKTIESVEGTFTTLDLSAFDAGIYLISVSWGNTKEVHKLIKIN